MNSLSNKYSPWTRFPTSRRIYNIDLPNGVLTVTYTS